MAIAFVLAVATVPFSVGHLLPLLAKTGAPKSTTLSHSSNDRSTYSSSHSKHSPKHKPLPLMMTGMDITADEFEQEIKSSDQASMINDEEFLLGVFLDHDRKGDWSVDQYLDATGKLQNESPLIAKLYKHHNLKEPFATQLAQMMDEQAKTLPATKAPPLVEDDDDDPATEAFFSLEK